MICRDGSDVSREFVLISRLFQIQRSMNFIVAVLLVMSACDVVAAQQEKASAQKSDVNRAKKQNESVEESASDKKSRVEVSDADRERAMNFAAENHPELARLLEQLQKSRPQEFSRAMKELNQQIQTLERVREKNAARYPAQLESWKHDSQIRVLMARWTRSRDVEIENQIRELLKKRREAKLAQLKADKDRLAEQQRKLDDQMAALMQPIETQVDKEWEQLSRKTGPKKDVNKKKSEASSAAENQ